MNKTIETMIQQLPAGHSIHRIGKPFLHWQYRINNRIVSGCSNLRVLLDMEQFTRQADCKKAKK